MDRTTTLNEGAGAARPANPLSNPIGAKVDNLARSAHDTTDRIADAAAGQIDRARETAHRAVDGAAATAQSGAGYASSMIDQAKQTQAKVLDSACTSIRARPLTAVVGAVIGGYLLGRLARF
jgi:ElaB/YqjD/DUF883 family membrane-anchored ribosome-binding protein